MPLKGNFYITKIPVLDSHQKIFAYYLTVKDVEDRPVSVNVLADLLVNVNIDKISGNYPVFLKVDPEVLEHDILDYLPENKVIFLLNPDSITPETKQIIKELKNIGFRFAFVYNEHFENIKDIADFLFVRESEINSEVYIYKDKAVITDIYSTEDYQNLLKEHILESHSLHKYRKYLQQPIYMQSDQAKTTLF